MKTYCVENEYQIPNIIKKETKAIKIMFKNIKKRFDKKCCATYMDYFLFKASPMPLQIKKLNRDLIIMFVNVKNEYGEFFSSIVDNLSENDIIVIIDAIIATKNDKHCHVYVQPENNPSVYLLKLTGSSLRSNLLKDKNLSKISGTGIYSLFGYVRKTAISADKECMWLKVKSSDESCINILRYPFAIHDTKRVNNYYKKCSKYFDVLIENPCNDFVSLVFGQQILLQNVKVNRVDNSNCFLLCVQGMTDHLKTITIGSNTNHITPLQQKVPNLNELIPTARIEANQIPIHEELKPLSTSCSKDECEINVPNSRLTVKSNSPPCKDNALLSSDVVYSTGKIMKKRTFADVEKIESYTSQNYSPSIIVKPNVQIAAEVNTFKRINSMTSSVIRKCSPDVEGMYLFLPSDNPDASESSASNAGPHRQVLHLSYLDKEKSLSGCGIRCIGPCRPVSIEPDLLQDDNDSSDFLSGYCEKCSSFTLKSYLITYKTDSDKKYKCSRCNGVVNLTFFFNLNFLYGKNETQTIKICCYNEKAEHMLRTLSKKNIKVEDYLLNYKCRKLVVDTMRKFIREKTKVNLVVLNSPLDNTFILVSISTNIIRNT